MDMSRLFASPWCARDWCKSSKKLLNLGLNNVRLCYWNIGIPILNTLLLYGLMSFWLVKNVSFSQRYFPWKILLWSFAKRVWYSVKNYPIIIEVKNVSSRLFNTLIERKSRMPQVQGIKSEAVVVYCELLITKEMGYYRLSRRVNKLVFFKIVYFIHRRVMKTHPIL